MSKFERDDFIAFRHQSGAICMMDSHGGWTIALDAQDIEAFIEWLRGPERHNGGPNE